MTCSCSCQQTKKIQVQLKTKHYLTAMKDEMGERFSSTQFSSILDMSGFINSQSSTACQKQTRHSSNQNFQSRRHRDVDRVLPLKSNWKQTRLGNHCTLVTNELVITGPLFPHKIIHKVTWISPDGRTRNQIDHVLINKRFRKSVEDTRVYRSADLGSDHYLVCKAKENRSSQIQHIKAEKRRYLERIQD